MAALGLDGPLDGMIGTVASRVVGAFLPRMADSTERDSSLRACDSPPIPVVAPGGWPPASGGSRVRAILIRHRVPPLRFLAIGRSRRLRRLPSKEFRTIER